MTSGQIFLVVTSIVAVGGIYFSPLTPSSKKSPDVSAMPAPDNDFNFETYKAEELKKLPEDVFAKYHQLNQDLETTSDKEAILKEITALLDSNDLSILAAFTRKEVAVLSNSSDSLLKSANELSSLAFTSDQPKLSRYVSSEAISVYQKVLELDPENTDAKINLAVAYLEGQAEPMKGVMILKEITDKDPDNITANLILGKYGMISGQFDKAVQRFEKVLSVDSLNAEAYLYLAEAYESMGDNEKAIEMLSKCRSLVNDPGFTNEIDNYIEKLRNS